MTTYSRGDVILVRYPNSDLRTYKRRPALVVQADEVQTGLDQKIVALITSNPRQGETRLTIRLNSPEGREMGLLTDSIIVADNLATVLEREIDRTIGRRSAMELVDAALKATLGLT